MTKQRDIEGGSGPHQAVDPVGRKLIAAIGIDRYRHRPLNNAVRDAKGTAAIFQQLGFEQITPPLLDEVATGAAIQSLVTDDLSRLLGPHDSLVLFYAGHGETRKDRIGHKVVRTGYLLPVDASTTRIATWLDLRAWLDAVARLPARHILVVIDACHSGIALDPVIRWRDLDSWQNTPMSTLEGRSSRRIITSAMRQQVAVDSGPIPGHSLFTGCLIEGLRHDIPRGDGRTITGSELALYVQRRVRSYRNSRQTPDFGTFAYDDRGEMLIPLPLELKPSAAIIGAPAAIPPTPLPAGEISRPRTGDASSDVSSHKRGNVMKLTLLAPLLAVPVLLAAGAFTGYNFARHPGEAGAKLPVPAPEPPPKRTKIVIGVNDFGGAFPAVVANDGMTAGPGSRFDKAGIDVEIRLIRKPDERLSAFDTGEVNVVLVTLDYLANLVPKYRDEKKVAIKAFLQADWSRGTLGIVATPKFRSVEELKDARGIATTQNTPSHYFLLTLLAKSNLKPPQIVDLKSRIVYAPETRVAGAWFEDGTVEAAAIWEPYLSRAIAGGKGHVLISTADATHLVPDVLFSRARFLTEHEADLIKFTRVWLQGVDMLAHDPERWLPMLAQAFHQTPEQTRDLLTKIKLTRFADNREFFGLDNKAAPYLSLFADASRVWLDEGVIKVAADAGSTRWPDALDALSGEHTGEVLAKEIDFGTAPGPGAASPTVLAKTVSIYFAPGSYRVDPNAKQRIDELAEILKQIANTYVTVEGNTDNTGDAGSHVPLSKARAQAVVDYLVAQGLDHARFTVVGNGMAKPKRDNSTEQGREENRRTDFLLHEHRR